MNKLLKFENYRMKHIRKYILYYVIYSIVYNNFFIMLKYKNKVLDITGEKYWKAFSSGALFIPLFITLLCGLLQNEGIKYKLHKLEIISGYSIQKIIISKSVLFIIYYCIYVNTLFISEFIVFSVINGIGSIDIFEFVAKNITYVIIVFTVSIISNYIMYLVEDAVKGTVFTALLIIMCNFLIAIVMGFVMIKKPLIVENIQMFVATYLLERCFEGGNHNEIPKLIFGAGIDMVMVVTVFTLISKILSCDKIEHIKKN